MNTTTAAVVITDNAIGPLSALMSEILPALGPHPVPQSDPRTNGLLVQFRKDTAAGALQPLPLLYQFILPQLNEGSDYILAVNQMPPTCADDFAMRPHIDRRWQEGAFAAQPPLFTTVMFLYFPASAEGGELVIFEDGNDIEALDNIGREKAREQLPLFDPVVVAPVPGRVCRFQGHLPHAVMGYSAPENEKWRLSMILAEFG